MSRRTLAAYLEIGSKRTFAGALEWPGWCRSGRTEEAALEALLNYAVRYANAIGDGFDFVPPSDASQLDIVERLNGGPTTDFGAPGAAAAADNRALDDRELERQILLLDAAWSALDRAAANARGVEVRKGPRGGGRDLPKMLGHVVEAERAYLGQLGSRSAPDAGTDQLRALVRDALRARAHGEPLANPRNTRKPWSPRYFVRRAAWHALDHAWEIEDRAER